MTFEQARKDFEIFRVYKQVKDKKGRWKIEDIDPQKWNDIPIETEGKIAIANCNEYFTMIPQERLVFILNKENNYE